MTGEGTPRDRLATEFAALRQQLADLEALATRFRQLEHSLHDLEELYRTIADNLQEGLTIIEGRSGVRYVNQRVLEIFGYPEDEFVKMTGPDFAAPEEQERLHQQAEDAARTGIAPTELEFWIVRKDGTRRCVRNRYSVYRKRDGSVGRLVITTDITEQKQTEETIRHLAYYDQLTGLSNRVLFNDRLKLELARASRNKQQLAVTMLDLDRFKDVNDAMGHAFGDQLLKTIGDRLTGLLRKSDTVARLGGDEFILLLPEVKPEGAAEVARRTMDAVREPIAIADHELTITTSIGIAIYPDDGTDAETLVKNADAAMYRAKEAGRNNYQRFSHESAGSE